MLALTHGLRRQPAIAVLTLAMGSLVAAGASAQTTIWYVDDTATGNNDGFTWEDAFTSLHDGLMAANGALGHQVWVAQGTYKPEAPPSWGGPDGSNRSFTFEIKFGVKVYGGFRGGPNGEQDLEDRAGLYARTILSGDLDGDPANTTQDAYHVVSIGDPNGSTAGQLLDGFTIELGNADGIAPDPKHRGGGLRAVNVSGLQLHRLAFKDNRAKHGGGLYVGGGDLSMSFCSFEDNFARLFGGGAKLEDLGESEVFNTFFDTNKTLLPNPSNDNYDILGHGGGLHIRSIDGRIRFCNLLMQDNRAGRGGAVYLDTNQPGGGLDTLWINCTIAYNNAATVGPPGQGRHDGAGFYVVEGGATRHQIVNSVLWANTGGKAGHEAIHLAAGANPIQVDYSDIQPQTVAWVGGNNIPSDPLFLSPDPDRNLHLSDSSPCIEAGDQSSLPLDVLDLDGDGDPNEPVPWSFTQNHLRLTDDPDVPGFDVDMGCHERLGEMGTQ